MNAEIWSVWMYITSTTEGGFGDSTVRVDGIAIRVTMTYRVSSVRAVANQIDTTTIAPQKEPAVIIMSMPLRS